MRYVKIFCLAAALALIEMPAHANLVTDPGFESCVSSADPPPGWTPSGNAYCSPEPHSGTWSAFLGTTSGGAEISQTIATTVGDVYDFSFWVWAGASGDGTDLNAFFGTDMVFSQSTLVPSYTFEDFQVTAVTGATTISFVATPSVDTVPEWLVDDVSVTDLGAPVPEPASLVLLGFGLAGLGIARWRKA